MEWEGVDEGQTPPQIKKGISNLNIEAPVFPKSKGRAERKHIWKGIQAGLGTCIYSCKVEVNCHHVAISSHVKKTLTQRE